jgi:hypothetical protein
MILILKILSGIIAGFLFLYIMGVAIEVLHDMRR